MATELERLVVVLTGDDSDLAAVIKRTEDAIAAASGRIDKALNTIEVPSERAEQSLSDLNIQVDRLSDEFGEAADAERGFLVALDQAVKFEKRAEAATDALALEFEDVVRSERAFALALDDLVQHERTAARATDQLEGEINDINSAMARGGRAAGRAAPRVGRQFGGALTQVSFALDDFLGVLAIGGPNALPAAIRSTANNFGTLATAINPIAGIATTIALSALPALVRSLGATGDAAEDASEDIKQFNDRLKEQLALQRELRGIRTGPENEQNLMDLREESSLLEERQRRLDELRRSASRAAEIGAPVAGFGNIEGLRVIGDILSGDPQGSSRRLEELIREAASTPEFLAEQQAIDEERQRLGQLQLEQRRRNTELQEEEIRNQLSLNQAIGLGTIGFGPTPFEQFRRGQEQDEAARREQKRVEELQRSANQLLQSFETQVISDPLERRLAEINNAFEKQIEDIRRRFEGDTEAELVAAAQRAREVALERAQGGPQPISRITAGAVAGSEEALQRILTAGMRDNTQQQQLAEQKKGNQNTKKIVDNTKKLVQNQAQVAQLPGGG